MENKITYFDVRMGGCFGTISAQQKAPGMATGAFCFQSLQGRRFRERHIYNMPLMVVQCV
jgi:hypothetical protein